VVGLETAQCEGCVADANGEGLPARKSVGDYSQDLAFYETQFQQPQADIGILPRGPDSEFSDHHGVADMDPAQWHH
jgi:hypothetical protein